MSVVEGVLAELLLKAKGPGAEFNRAFLAVKLAHGDGDREQAKQFLGFAALEARTDEETNRLADFCKAKGY